MELTMWQEHKKDWENCTRCPLHESRYKIVLGRGSTPCNLVLLGEAPGTSEDSEGKPFCGPAGFILNQIIERSIPSNITYAITNMLGCIPVDEDGEKSDTPNDEHIAICSPRVEDFIRVCDEGRILKFIVTVGNYARDWLDQRARNTRWKPHVVLHRRIPSVHIKHPSAMLRTPIAQRSLDVQYAVVTIQNAIEEYITFPTVNEYKDVDEIKEQVYKEVDDSEIPF